MTQQERPDIRFTFRFKVLAALALAGLAACASPPAPLRLPAMTGLTLPELIGTPSNLPMPPVQTGEAAFAGQFQGRHQIALLNIGVASYEARLRMIESAESEVDFEYYVFEPDTAGQGLLRAAAARMAEMTAKGKPFRVRLLLDRLILDPGNPGLSKQQLSELVRHRIEVRLFNYGAGPRRYNYRSHKKLFLVDGKEFITGGRNIESRYFGIASPADYPGREYYDTDIYVRGPAAAGAQGAFNAFWNSPEATPVKTRDGEGYPTFLDEGTPVDPLFTAARVRGSQRLAEVPVIESDPITFLSDKPGDKRENRRTMAGVLELDRSARKSLAMENWTMAPVRDEEALFSALLKRDIPIWLVTNSLRSADESSVIDLAFPELQAFARQGMRIYVLSGRTTEDVGLDESANRAPRWATHSKVVCVDARSCFIGSANNDSRSENINAEVGVIVHENPEFAAMVLREIRGKIMDSYLLDPNGRMTKIPAASTGGGPVLDIGPTPEEIRKTTGLKAHLLRVLKYLE